MRPLKGRTIERWVSLHSKKLAVPMCVSGGFIRQRVKEKKKQGSGFSQSDKTQTPLYRGAGHVFSLRYSRLMQNKRASLNIQQEKLQQSSIWPLLLCGSMEVPSFLPFILSFCNFLLFSFFVNFSLPDFLCCLPRFAFLHFCSCMKKDKRVNILPTRRRHTFYLFILE